MEIKIDTRQELSDIDREILAVILGVALDFDEEPDTEQPAGTYSTDAGEVAEVKPTKVKKTPEPEPEPEPEPMAEESVEEDEPEVEDEPEDEADDMSDEDLLALAVKKATEMVGKGEAAAVREALDAAGASRVRELNADNVREFFKALP